MADTYECGTEAADSIKYGEFVDWLTTGYLLKKDCAVWSE